MFTNGKTTSMALLGTVVLGLVRRDRRTNPVLTRATRATAAQTAHLRGRCGNCVTLGDRSEGLETFGREEGVGGLICAVNR
jgi:hypothetical protein